MKRFNLFPQALGASLVLAAGAASAAVDTTVITGTLTDIAAVGAAVFAVMVGVKLYKWVRRAL
jgi:Inovirus Coat protein B